MEGKSSAAFSHVIDGILGHAILLTVHCTCRLILYVWITRKVSQKYSPFFGAEYKVLIKSWLPAKSQASLISQLPTFHEIISCEE